MATPNDSNTILAPYWERAALWAGGAIIALLCIGYQDMKSTVDKVETNVQILFLEKVNKEDMKELEARWFNRLEATNSETRALIKSSNDDVLSRLDLYFKAREK